MKKLEPQGSMIEVLLLLFICYRATRDKFASFPLADRRRIGDIYFLDAGNE
jgi:hypothetical protein